MNTRPPVLALLILAAVPVRAADTDVVPEPGPEEGGLRLRLVVAPRTDLRQDGYEVRVDLLNISDRATTLRGAWRYDETGDLNDYLDAATSIECVPAVQRWM